MPFNFSTERVINSFSIPGNATTGSSASQLVVGPMTFKSADVTNIYKRVGTAATTAYVRQTTAGWITTLTGAGTYRLTIDAETVNSSPAAFYRIDAYSGKPQYVEFTVAATPADQAGVIAILNKALAKIGGDFADGKVVKKVVTSDSVVGQLNVDIVASSEYIRIKNLYVEKLNLTTNDWDVVYTLPAPVNGKEAFGNTWWILKNLRLPTAEAIRFSAINLDERPIDGALYDEFTFSMNTTRNIRGNSVVGEVANSTTSHTFYVKNDLSASFQTLIDAAFAGKTTTI